jgi:hypothetical protein
VVIHPPECEASVAIDPVPPQVGDLESFAPHGLHGIPENCLHLSDFCQHANSNPPNSVSLEHQTDQPSRKLILEEERGQWQLVSCDKQVDIYETPVSPVILCASVVKVFDLLAGHHRSRGSKGNI